MIFQICFNWDVFLNCVFDVVFFLFEDFWIVVCVFDDVKINDVVLVVCSGVFCFYLLEKNELLEELFVVIVLINMWFKDVVGVDDGNNILVMVVFLFINIVNLVDWFKLIVCVIQVVK